MIKFEYKYTGQYPVGCEEEVCFVLPNDESTYLEVIEVFERFLKAVGYTFDGNITYVEHDEEVVT